MTVSAKERGRTWPASAKKLEGFALIVGGYYDHAHLLVRIPAKIAVSDFVGRVKANTLTIHEMQCRIFIGKAVTARSASAHRGNNL